MTAEFTPQQRADLRAQHTCIRDMSSMNCRACNHGVPYPALTPSEVEQAVLGAGRESEAAIAALLARPGRRR